MEHRMNCSEVQNLIPQYLSGELDDDTRREVEEHISGCPDCQEGMRREQSLGDLIGQSADDPPEEYWDSYNDKVRSRIRGVVGMLWRLGILAGCLAGLIGGFAEHMGIWNFASSSTCPPLLRTIEMWCLVVGLAVVLGFLFKRFSTYGLPRYERDETSLKHAIAMNPVYRWTLVSLFVLLLLGAAVYLPLAFIQSPFMPGWAVWTLRVLVFIGFASGIPGSCRTITDYLDGRDLHAEWARKSIKQRLTAYPIVTITMLLLMVTCEWQVGMLKYVNAPMECRQRADALFSSGDTQSAVSILESGIRKYGDRYGVLDCYTRLGEIYKKTGHPAEARDTYRAGTRAYKYLVRHPKSYYRKQDRLRLLSDAANLYFRLGENKSAFDVSTVRLQTGPDDAENIFSVALDYECAGYKDEAKVLYDRITIEFPNTLWAHAAKDCLNAPH